MVDIILEHNFIRKKLQINDYAFWKIFFENTTFLTLRRSFSHMFRNLIMCDLQMDDVTSSLTNTGQKFTYM
jgi:hypothetical protein